MDDGKAAHDAEAVSSVAQEAIALAQTKHQLKMTQQEERDAWALTRHVATRWNSDFACLASHVELETPVKQLTSDSENDLGKYALNREQWKLAKELVEVLEVRTPYSCVFIY
jgi:hypothetical protein